MLPVIAESHLVRESCEDRLMCQGGVSGLVAGTVFKTVERQALSLAVRFPSASARGVVNDPRRRPPRTDAVLAEPRVAEAERALGRKLVKAAVSAAQETGPSGQDSGGGRRR